MELRFKQHFHSMKPTYSIILRATKIVVVGFVAVALAACNTIADCGNVLGNKEDPRIRSSTMRMLLAEPAAASARFAPYAAMSALVYEEAATCKHRLPPVAHKDELNKLLAINGWRLYNDIAELPECDDDVGTFFRVWVKAHTDHTEAVIVFRGTKGVAQDWITGNLRWFTKFLPGDDQYDRSRHLAGLAIARLKQTVPATANGHKLRIYTAGHSLGGGLAQNVLYAYPIDVIQAYTFNSSPVTGFDDDANDRETKRSSCNCRTQELGIEARVFRIYETDEVLSWLRFPLKFAVPLNRHIQEIRFNFGNGHSMSGLAKDMADSAASRPLAVRNEWWKGKPEKDGASCTSAYTDRLRASCEAVSDAQVCPR
jgi:pimeloyl-ACP methyl ester carboxylesterase